MHKLLERQLKKIYGSLDSVPPGSSVLIDSVDKTYNIYDQDYVLLERSLDISSKELQELNENLRREIKLAKVRESELKRFSKLMIGRELKMLELKKEIKLLKSITK